jgi:SAM-dependent methyltransferase
VTWSLEQAHGIYPQVEEELSAALEESLSPRGPGQLLDLVAAMGLPPGAVAPDVGCGEGSHALALHQRFEFRVTGVDPVPRHIQAARAAADRDGPAFEPGTAEDIPASPGTVDLVWCRDVLVHSPDLLRAYAEFRRVLRPASRALVYQMFATELLEPRERAWLFGTMGVAPAAARLQRDPDRYIARFGRTAYDMMLGDCLWQVYALVCKLTRRIYLLSSPGTAPTATTSGAGTTTNVGHSPAAVMLCDLSV